MPSLEAVHVLLNPDVKQASLAVEARTVLLLVLCNFSGGGFTRLKLRCEVTHPASCAAGRSKSMNNWKGRLMA